MSEIIFNSRTVADIFPASCEEILNPKVGPMLPWWPTISRYLGGLRPHEVTLICAPTGAGKTELLSNISSQLFLDEVPHFVAPVETGDTDFVTRMMGTITGQSLNMGERVGFGAIDRFVANYGEKMGKNLVQISNYDNRVPIEEMIGLMGWHHQQTGTVVNLLDNLNFFMQVTRASDQVIEMDHAIHELVMAHKELPVHTFLVVHPKKTDGGRVESEFDIKGSSTAVQECANVMLFNRPRVQEVQAGLRQWTNREVIFKKIRKRGVYVNKPVWLDFQNNRYVEIQE